MGMSKKLSEIEQKKQGYLARQVEASDKKRVGTNPVVSGAVDREGGDEGGPPFRSRFGGLDGAA